MPVKPSRPAIEIEDITYTYGSTTVLDRLTCRIEAGSYVGIIGPNGGGKTTLLKLLLGLLSPDSGTISVLGTPVRQLKRRYMLGYVPQRVSQENLQFPATVYEVVASGLTAALQPFESPRQADKKRIEEAMETAGISDLRDTLIGNLSGGQRQRAFVARALVGKPSIMLLDEPFTGVDIASQQQFYALLKKLNKQQGLTILFVSHDIDVVSKEVDELLCLNKRLVCQGAPGSVIEDNIIENLYGKRVTHLHHNNHS